MAIIDDALQDAAALDLNRVYKSTFVEDIPASTRSSTKQATLEDVGAGSKDGAPTRTASKTAKPAGKKRKASPQRPTNKRTKPAKQPDPSPAKEEEDTVADDGDNANDTITINRAPVLELWAACLTHHLHPSLSWPTSLSVGSAISTLAAISKGRSIGKMDKPDPGEAQAKRERRREEAKEEELEEVEVMGFNLHLKEGMAVVSGKPKKGNEAALIKKYGGEEAYSKVKAAMQESLEKWEGKDDELDKRAFGMYEDFRPSVMPGQAGWGKKGELKVQMIKEVVGG